MFFSPTLHWQPPPTPPTGSKILVQLFHLVVRSDIRGSLSTPPWERQTQETGFIRC